jgi:hypothetical protein
MCRDSPELFAKTSAGPHGRYRENCTGNQEIRTKHQAQAATRGSAIELLHLIYVGLPI